MSNLLPSGELRRRLRSALEAASITAGGDPVSILKTPASGEAIPADRLPAMYLISSSEVMDFAHLGEVEHRLEVQCVMHARDEADPQDALDEMQLALARIVIEADGFGLARSLRLVSVEAAHNQGVILVGSRIARIEAVISVTADDPSL